ncbi:MAG: hypothetical protein KIT84_18955 [Labilithrix sp.]|nr:hypothetical protein [Labilithrix sp.]MCW5813115.1 hypothetical protein [Labilithrix sp.]
MRPTLAPVLGAIVAALAPVACYSDPTPMPETVPCLDLHPEDRYAGLSLGPSADGAVFRSFVPARHKLPAAPGARATTGTLGTPCSGATNREDCLARVEAARSDEEGWRYDGNDHAIEREYGVVTSGDDVRVITTVEELRALVAPIDTLAEAAIVAALSRRSPTCSGPNARTESDGFVLRQVYGGCEDPVVERLFKVHRDGKLTDLEQNEIDGSTWGCSTGRRPIAYEPPPRPWLASLPAYLAELAHLEAASVLAFEDLHENLATHRAPSSLLARTTHARRDELVHAHLMTTHARALSAPPARGTSIMTHRGRSHAGPNAPPTRSARITTAHARALGPALARGARGGSVRRSILELAVDNAVEGCVREAYGALVATYQATHAADPALRRTFRRIARDEAEHAALALDLADWYATKLTVGDRAIVENATAAAWRALAHGCEREVPCADIVRAAGVPTPSVARSLATALREALAT